MHVARGSVPLVTRRPRLLSTLVLALFLLLLPTSARAASNDVIRDLDIAIDIRPDGMLEVTETYRWDFGSRAGLGFTRVLDSRFDYPPDPDMVRVYRYEDFTASSPSSAPAGVWRRDQGARVRVDVGAPDGSDDRRSGVQTYVLRYTVSGALNAIRDQAGVADQEELYWNATGLDWDIPIESSSVTVTGPAGVVDHACYQGRQGSTASCDTLAASGSRVSAGTGRLSPGEGMTIMAAFPVGTFGEIVPILQPAPPPAPGSELFSAADSVADFLRGNAAWLLPLGVAGPVGLALRRRHKGKDLHFVGLPPGVLPAAGQEAEVAQLTSEPTVAVRFTPPDGLRPAEVGAVTEKRVTTEQVSATIIDLAVRGYLHIEEVAGHGLRRKDWQLTATPKTAPREELRNYERLLLEQLFRGRRRVRLSSLRNTFATTMKQARSQVRTGVWDRRLFSKPLPAGGGGGTPLPAIFIVTVWAIMGLVFVRNVMSTGIGSLVLVIGIALALLAAFGLAMALTARARRQRTATGRAMYEQGRGFALYLSTAEGHQLRFEEGVDIFSRYLPYAMVFGVAERWAGIFEQLRQQGVQVAQPTWYTGSTGTFDSRSFRSMSQAVSQFSSSAASTLSSTPGSSGGSGSSGGGGGSSGGGGGGGGGGGR